MGNYIQYGIEYNKKTVEEKAPDFYRGEHCNFMPSKVEVRSDIKEFLLKGLIPDKPFITRDMIVTAFGSCFADQIRNYLTNKGYNPYQGYDCCITRHGEGMTNTYTVLQQLEWAYESREFPEDVWYIRPAWHASSDKEQRKITIKLLDSTNIFIITLGLSEVWYDKQTGNVFWRAIPGKMFDPNKHGFRVTTCQENIDNIKKIIKILNNRPNPPYIILTLSPIKLRATFRNISCPVANSASKAILKASLDEVIREDSRLNKTLFYWPSYEIINELYPNPYREDNQHIENEIVFSMMDIFSQYYLIP